MKIPFALLFLAAWGCSGSGGAPGTGSGPTIIPREVGIDAAATTGSLRPLWRDHYDLSFEHFDYPSEPGFDALLASLAPRSWRCSIGRWEIGFPPPAGGASTDPGVLALVEREFYRGPNTLAGADDPANYAFAYLDAQLASLTARGLDPYLCFDYMPFSLAAEQDPLNANNFNISNPGTPYSIYSFSNGIRTSPPADPPVYARVVRNTLRHVRGLFAGSTDYGVQWFEIGNEPDLVAANGNALPYFWTGTAEEFFNMYAAIAAEVDGDAQLSTSLLLGAGSFALLPSVPGFAFLQDFLTRVAVASPRLNFLSFHSYGDEPNQHAAKFGLVRSLETSLGLANLWVNAEWGRELGDPEPTYDAIEHGIFRAKVLGLMQLYPFVLAHEALFRDPGTSGGELGLVRTGPPAHKPVSRIYQGLARLNTTPELLEVTDNPDSLFVLPGRNSGGTRVAVALVLDNPAPGTRERFSVQITNLPWGSAPFTVQLSRVTQASSNAGLGIEPVSTEPGSGGEHTAIFDIDPGDQGLYILELFP